MKKIKLFALLLVLLTVASSCKKEEGPAGPQGPEGPAGTANVIYSDWIGFQATSWSETAITEFGKTMRHYYDTVPEITQNIVDKGLVMVYIKSAGTPEAQPLPMTIYGLTQFVNQFMTFRLSNNLLTIIFFNIDNNDDPGSFAGDPSTNAYRYIIIPGGISASMANFNQMSYQEICKKLNIEK
ncbi:MAG: hypothetical protein PHR81_03205 [Bacteroidales bacterium]|jgi:hypothetical protein|nr:hypothetical protein [Bacteroidales bacterium]MDD4213798.1 hypothetical protein [Bacteroidales bacterium]